MPAPASNRFAEVFLAFLRQGLTAFGGPVAHLGYFRAEFVVRRQWLSEAAYADLVAMCQFLPGPASSQVGMSIGFMRAGYAGLLAAWLGFTLPSAIALTLFAYGLSHWGNVDGGWIHGLKIAAVAVVASAVLAMARSLAPDRIRASLAVGAAVLALLIPTALGQIGAIVIGAAFGLVALHQPNPITLENLPPLGSRRVAVLAGTAFLILLVGLPLAAAATHDPTLNLFSIFYRAGSLVFGGGHVVLPLLQADIVPALLDKQLFLAGYGAAQAVPGPLFTFATYLGALIGNWPGALLATIAIFLPSALLILAALPFWDQLRRQPNAQSALRGINAAVVGLLLAALYNPVWTAGILTPADFALAAVAFLLLVLWRTPPLAVVALCAIAGAFGA